MPTKLTQINLDGTLYDIGADGGFGGIEMIGITLSSSGWSGNSQTVTVSSNAIATSDYLAIPQLETAEKYAKAGIVLANATPDVSNQSLALQFTCGTAPTSNVDVVVLVSTSAMQTQIDLAEAIGNFPRIQNGVWYTYNPNTQTWVNSGVKAGITSITQTTTSNADGGNNIITAVLSDNTTTTFTIKNGTKGSQGEKGDSATYYFRNMTVSEANWNSNSTYAGFPYMATLTTTGVTANDGVEVTFDTDTALSGNYAPVANTVANGVQIWGKTNDAITIPTIAITPPAATVPTTSSYNISAQNTTVTLASGGWTASNGVYVQTVSINWMLASDIPFCQGICNSQADSAAWGDIIKAESNTGSITFTSLSALTQNLSVQVVVAR